jgi:phosphatidylserine decarboxylase
VGISNPLKKLTMGKRIRKIKNIRLHHEGNETLLVMGASLAVFNAALYWLCRECCIWLFYSVAAVSVLLYSIIVNFFRCPLRHYEGDTERTVVASADGKIVVIEEVEENEYFHDRRLMISIFMSVTNVHANWFPVEGVVKMVRHHNGNFYKAWLPKASTENERSTVVIETPEGDEVLVRQIAGAVARRIVTYAKEGEDCVIDEHMGFIKFGSRVDVYLPLGTEVLCEIGQRTTGNQTVIAKLPEL